MTHKTLSDATTSGQSGSRRDGNKGVLYILLTEASPLDCLVSYLGHSLGESYPSTEMQLVYSTAPANLAVYVNEYIYIYKMVLPKISENVNMKNQIPNFLFCFFHLDEQTQYNF